MFVLTPTAIPTGYGYPLTSTFTNHPHYHRQSYARPYPLSIYDSAVEQAAYDYAVAQARAEALREERARAQAYARQQEQERIRRYVEAKRREESLRRAREQEELLQAFFSQHSSRRIPYGYSRQVTPPTFEEVVAYRQEQAEIVRQREFARRREAALYAQRRQQQEEEKRRAMFFSLFGIEEAPVLDQKPTPSPHKAPSVSLPISRSAPTLVPEHLKPSRRSEDEEKVYEAFAQELLGALFGVAEGKPTPSRPAEKQPVASSSKPKSIVTPSAASSLKVDGPTHEERTLHDLLSERFADEDAEIQETAFNLIKELYGISDKESIPTDVKGKGKARAEPSTFKVRFQTPVKESTSVPDLKRASDITPLRAEEAKEARETLRERHPDVSSSPTLRNRTSLDQINTIASDLHKLEAGFTFPTELDFVLSSPATPAVDVPATATPASETPSQELAYTSRNRPLKEYEHALGALLERLDAVDSQGDEDVRGRRREIVREIERALDELDKAVREGRERSVSRSRERTVSETVREPIVESFVTPTLEAKAVEEVSPEATSEVKVAIAEPTVVEEQVTTELVSVPTEGSQQVPTADGHVPTAISVDSPAENDANVDVSSKDVSSEESSTVSVAVTNTDFEDETISPITTDSQQVSEVAPLVSTEAASVHSEEQPTEEPSQDIAGSASNHATAETSPAASSTESNAPVFVTETSGLETQVQQSPSQAPSTPTVSFLLQTGTSPLVDPEQKTPAYTDSASEVSSVSDVDVSESEFDDDTEVIEHAPRGVRSEGDVKSEDGWDVVE